MDPDDYNHTPHPVDVMVDDAIAGEPTVIAKNGQPVAVVIGTAEYENLLAAAGVAA